MKTEKRIYLVSADTEFKGDLIASQISDEDFMAHAEDEGKVYTLEGFFDAFNKKEINSAVDFIRMIEVPLSPSIDTEPHMGLINKVELASDLARSRMYIEMGVPEEDSSNPLIVGEPDDIFYTPEAQDIFNKWYDYYSTKIENTEV